MFKDVQRMYNNQQFLCEYKATFIYYVEINVKAKCPWN